MTAVVWGLWLVSLVAVMLGWAVALPAGIADAYSIVSNLILSLAAVSVVTGGAVLVTRVPDNRVGWLLWAGGSLLGFAMSDASALPGTVPGVVWLAWLANLAWVPGIVLVGALVPLFFPTGQLPSARWRTVVIVVLAGTAIATLQTAFAPFSPGSAPAGTQNPLALGGAAATVLEVVGSLSTVAGVVCFPLIAWSLVIRYRRAAGLERAQLRWFAAAALLTGLGFALALLLGAPTAGVALLVSNVAWLLTFVGMVLLPAAVAVAVLRYRLYEIDRLVSRTIAYGVVTVLLLAVLGGAILLLEALLAPFTSSSEIAVAGSTLLVAALFQPLRRRVQRLVDRRFNRSHYDAERTLVAFAARLRDEVDLEAIGAEIVATVAGAVEPATAVLWLRHSA